MVILMMMMAYQSDNYDDGIKIKMVLMIKKMMMVITLTMMMMTKPTPCMVHPVMTV